MAPDGSAHDGNSVNAKPPQSAAIDEILDEIGSGRRQLAVEIPSDETDTQERLLWRAHW